MSRPKRRGELEWTTVRVPVDAHDELEEVLAEVSAQGTGILPPPLDAFAAEEQAKTGSRTITRGVIMHVALRYLWMSVVGRSRKEEEGEST